jgi:hypothetical protein
MSKYPDWLIRKVAAAGAKGVDDCNNLYTDGKHSKDYIEEWEAGAEAILDALGFEEHHDRGILIGGVLHHCFPTTPEVRMYSKWVSRTEWRGVE